MLEFDEEPPARPGQVVKAESDKRLRPLRLAKWPYATMHEARLEHQFFVPGLICRWSQHLFSDPYLFWRDAQQAAGKELGLLEIVTKNQCVDFCSTRLHADNWPSTIWAVPADKWEALKKFLCAVTIAEDAALGTTHSVGVHPLLCDDFLAPRAQKGVEVWFFGIYSHPPAEPGTHASKLKGGVALHAEYDKLSGQIIVVRSNTPASPL